jgi:hypothetical protein
LGFGPTSLIPYLLEIRVTKKVNNLASIGIGILTPAWYFAGKDGKLVKII